MTSAPARPTAVAGSSCARPGSARFAHHVRPPRNLRLADAGEGQPRQAEQRRLMEYNLMVMENSPTVSVLFVCMGNICRSPTAQGVFEQRVRGAGLAGRVEADSAGTLSYHVGSPPDPRAQAAARGRGIELAGQRARQVRPEDFDQFDYVVAMDRDNHAALAALCPPGREDRLHLMMELAPESAEREVPDPYYGGDRGFERVLDMLELASTGLLNRIREELDGGLGG